MPVIQPTKLAELYTDKLAQRHLRRTSLAAFCPALKRNRAMLCYIWKFVQHQIIKFLMIFFFVIFFFENHSERGTFWRIRPRNLSLWTSLLRTVGVVGKTHKFI